MRLLTESLLLICAQLIQCSSSLLEGTRVSAMFDRSRRSLLEFGIMIKCSTGRWPLDYNGYGCYCGRGGKGHPIDEVDACCKQHDECYDRLLESNACKNLVHAYIRPYRFWQKRCWKKDAQVTCYSKRPCSRGLCHCDRQAALCFSRAKYNEDLEDFDRDKCHLPWWITRSLSMFDLI
ncbi:phospholipase A2-like isoform X2 [Lytechinus variegatus]|nr:phospholipase A2-like isoform X2 [Lytechinus variegatus]